MSKDPVCGIEVAETDAPARCIYKGRRYYFCCVKTCKAIFEMARLGQTQESRE